MNKIKISFERWLYNLKMCKVLIMCHPADRPRNTVNSRGSRDQAGKASIIHAATIRGSLRGFQFYNRMKRKFLLQRLVDRSGEEKIKIRLY